MTDTAPTIADQAAADFDCPGCYGTGDCMDCANADSYTCGQCLCTGECPECEGTGKTTKEG